MPTHSVLTVTVVVAEGSVAFARLKLPRRRSRFIPPTNRRLLWFNSVSPFTKRECSTDGCAAPNGSSALCQDGDHPRMSTAMCAATAAVLLRPSGKGPASSVLAFRLGAPLRTFDMSCRRRW